MKLQKPFIFFLVLAITLFLYKKGETNDPKTVIVKNLKLIVEREAFQFDKFELTPSKISYYPEKNAQHTLPKYNMISEVAIDSSATLRFFEELEKRGFSSLKNEYTTSSSCTSELKITLFSNGKKKSVRCDDFERGCPELLQYIDKKVVELEGNDLKRIYLPG